MFPFSKLSSNRHIHAHFIFVYRKKLIPFFLKIKKQNKVTKLIVWKFVIFLKLWSIFKNICHFLQIVVHFQNLTNNDVVRGIYITGNIDFLTNIGVVRLSEEFTLRSIFWPILVWSNINIYITYFMTKFSDVVNNT